MNASDSIRYIGVDDLDIDLFESQYIVPEGMSYNSWVISWGVRSFYCWNSIECRKSY